MALAFVGLTGPLAACGQPVVSRSAATVRPSPSPSLATSPTPVGTVPTPSPGGLVLTGTLVGTVASTTPGSSCGTYGSGYVGQARFPISGVEYELVVDIASYSGPGHYAAPPARVSVHKVAIDNNPVLLSGTSGSVDVDPGGTSGTVDENLLGSSGPAHVGGTWRC